jgi:cyanophycin synthetase
VKELVAEVNSAPDRGEEHEKPLTKIVIDEVARYVLNRQGLTPSSVPAAGKTVWLRDNANLSTGGTAIDVTDQVNPQLADTVVRAVRLVGLDVAGVDLVCKDVTEPLLPRSGAIIEINAAPGIRMHHYPVAGESRDVADAILSSMFPPGSNSEIPLVAVTGTNGKTTTARLIAHTLRQCYRVVGMTSTEGIYLNDRCIVTGDTTGPWSANLILDDPSVEAAVLEVARGGLLRGGLGYEQSDVAVLTNVSEDHLGQDNLETLEDLVWVKSTVLEAVRPSGHAVVNADDASLQQVLPRLRSQVIMFSQQPDNPHVRRHLGAGGQAVFVVDGAVCLSQGHTLQPLVNVSEIPITWEGKASYNVANALAAAAALWGLGVDQESISLGLSTFQPLAHNPGRQNLRQVAGRRVMIDYAHNIAGIQGLSQLARNLCPGRLLGVVAVPGDRRSATIFRVGQAAAQGFDQLYIKEDQDRRGRAPGEVAEILRQGAVSTGMSPTAVSVYLQEVEALRAALSAAGPDDLVVVLYEQLWLTNQLLQSLEREISDVGRQSYVVAGSIDPA